MIIADRSYFSINKIDKILTVLIFIDWILYENVFFLEVDEFGGGLMKFFIYSFKLFLPLLILIYAKIPAIKFFKSSNNSIYVISFTLFIIWGFVPTIFFGTLVSWTKLIPIFILSISVISFFIKKPGAAILIMKLYIFYVMFSLLQYIIINIFQIYESASNNGLVGPFGLLGNIRSRIYFPLISNPIIRLCGFWKEPSNAAGASFAAFFLAKYIYEINKYKLWKFASYFCLLTGFLTISNAGYLSIGVAIFIGFLFNKNKSFSKKMFSFLIILPIIISMLWLSLFSRDYFNKHPTDNIFILAVTGLRSSNMNENFDPSDGRFDLFTLTLDTISKNFIGVGIQVTGPSGINCPAGAPLFWLFLTGIPGFIFLVVREYSLFKSIKISLKKNSNNIFLGQAIIAVLTQQAIYGSWMDPNYVILSSLVLAFKNSHISDFKN